MFGSFYAIRDKKKKVIKANTIRSQFTQDTNETEIRSFIGALLILDVPKSSKKLELSGMQPMSEVSKRFSALYYIVQTINNDACKQIIEFFCWYLSH